MKVICKEPGGEACAYGLNICCGICDKKDGCEYRCNADHSSCTYAETITNEVAQFESAVPDVIQKITSILHMKKELDEQEKAFKQQLLEAMETYGVKSFETDLIKMTYVAPTTRSTIDSAKLKKDHPDIAEQYSKTSNVSASVRVTVK